MTYTFYKVVHLIGVAMVFMSLGGLILHGISGDGAREHKGRKLAMMTHGIGMIVVLVGGMGAHAKLALGWQGWVFGKLGLWFVAGGLVAVASRKPSGALWWACITLFGLATWLAVYKPF